jgi:hypothetical protein
VRLMGISVEMGRKDKSRSLGDDNPKRQKR